MSVRLGGTSSRLHRGSWTSLVARRIRQGRGSLIVATGALLLAYASGRQIGRGSHLAVILILGGVAAVVCTLRPHWGLYAFAATIILVPYDWRLPGLKGASPSALMVVGAFVGWWASVALGQRVLRFSRLYALLALAWGVTLAGLIRYGSGFVNVPLVLGEGIVLFVLAYHLIRGTSERWGLLTALSLALVVRNGIDIAVTALSILQGDRLGAIRNAYLLYDVAATSESEWRGFLLPMLIMGAISARRSSLRMLFWVATLTNIAWLALSATRTAYLILGLAPIMMLLVMPGRSRLRVLWVALPSALLAVFLATSFSDAWTHVLSRTQEGLVGGLANESTRVEVWRLGLDAFFHNPLFGHSLGPSHSWFFEMARTMGLMFLVPMLIALWMLWRRCAFLRTRRLQQDTQWFVIGFQGGMLIAMVFSLIGVFFRGGGAALYFWLFAGALEALYEQNRLGGEAIGNNKAQPVAGLTPAPGSRPRRMRATARPPSSPVRRDGS